MARLEGLFRVGVFFYTIVAAWVAMLILGPLSLIHGILDAVWRLVLDRDFSFGQTAPDQMKHTQKWAADNLHYAYTGNKSPSWTADNTGLRAI